MKKSKKVGLIVITCSVLLFGLTVFLQYKVFHKEESKELYKKVTMKNLSSGKIEQVSKENMIEEVVENPLVPEGQQAPTVEQQPQVEQQQPTEEVVPEEEIKEITTYEDITTTPVEPVVYDGLTLNQLAEKLNRSLKSNIAGKGYLIASHCLESILILLLQLCYMRQDVIKGLVVVWFKSVTMLEAKKEDLLVEEEVIKPILHLMKELLVILIIYITTMYPKVLQQQILWDQDMQQVQLGQAK